MKVVIIGGVAGGAGAAARIRRLDDDAEIVMLERGGYISFANCGLPYHVGDVIVDERCALEVLDSRSGGKGADGVCADRLGASSGIAIVTE